MFVCLFTNQPTRPFVYDLVTGHKKVKIWYTEVFPHLGKGAMYIFVLSAYFVAVSTVLSSLAYKVVSVEYRESGCAHPTSGIWFQCNATVQFLQFLISACSWEASYWAYPR